MAEVRMDTLFAATYDDHWGGYSNASHVTFVQRLLDLCPPGCAILDAACGTGKYWPMILASGRSVTGIDQSREMLNKAHHCYFTVEIIDENERQEAFAQGKAQGLPLIEGEYTIGGYHYYPPIAQARRWTVDAGFTVMDEGDGYYHFLTQKQSM